MSTASSPKATYEHRLQEATTALADLDQRSRRLSGIRLACFSLAAIAGLMVLLSGASPTSPWMVGIPLGLFLFAIAARIHAGVIAQQERQKLLIRVNQEALARLSREWASISLPSWPDPGTRPLIRDLNLAGRSSLAHLLSTARTPPGKSTLWSWLTDNDTPGSEIAGQVTERQEAVAELSSQLALRQELMLRALPMDQTSPDPAPFLAWARAEPWLLERRHVTWLARLQAVLAPGLLIAAAVGVVPWSVWGLTLITGLLLSRRYQDQVARVFDEVSAHEGAFLAYSSCFEILAETQLETPLLTQVQLDLTSSGVSAHKQMKRLHDRVILSDARHSGSLHAALQILFAWDFHTLLRIEQWQVSAGRHAGRWFEALGIFEALSALAGLAYDQPSWTFPTIETTDRTKSASPRFEAKDLGHPLLPDSKRVGNDVEIGPPGTFLLVTGSNMSGKGTLLRAVGLNCVLAQAGGPVCATSLRLYPVALGTSVLVEDSLEQGLSFFMAELRRLREIVSEAQELAETGGRVHLYLLDEILRGTNAAERRVAVGRVLDHLLTAGAIGAISTHDLELASLEGLEEACRPVHFRETLHPRGDGPPMTFDFRMRPGIAPTTNALELLELVGLGDFPRPESDPPVD